MSAAVRARPRAHPVRRWAWGHPEWWVVGLAGAAWAGLTAGSLVLGDHMGHGDGPSWRTVAMVAAMMLPLVVPHVRFVVGSSLWRRRVASVAWFIAGYFGLWVLVQVGLEVGWSWASPALGATGAAVAVAVAALWEVSDGQSRRQGRCHRLARLAPWGWRADAACARYGAATGVRCVAVCWPAMLMCAAFSHGLIVMAFVFGVQLSGRYRADAPPWWRSVALVVTGAIGLATGDLL